MSVRTLKNLEENTYKVLKCADRKIIPLINYALAQQFSLSLSCHLRMNHYAS